MRGQRPYRVSRILRECFDERDSSSIAIRFLHLFNATEITARRSASLFWCESSPLVVSGQQLQMRTDFFVEPIVSATTPECGGDAVQDGAHHDLSSSSRDIIATVRDHRSASIDSCFFPARVIE